MNFSIEQLLLLYCYHISLKSDSQIRSYRLQIIIIPLMQTFGLIFKDTFVEMGLSATQGSLIINLNAAFGMIMGMVNGFLLKMFGYRKIALMASFLVTMGVILTSFATTFTHFMITYGLITC
jgi:nitrate/nitrite transporter NarK